jgi:hypothetical protein
MAAEDSGAIAGAASVAAAEVSMAADMAGLDSMAAVAVPMVVGMAEGTDKALLL